MSLKGRQLSVEAGQSRRMEVAADNSETKNDKSGISCFFGANLRFQRRMEVTTGRGSDEGRRLANLFQQVTVDCKVSGGLGKEFSVSLIGNHSINSTSRGCRRW